MAGNESCWIPPGVLDMGSVRGFVAAREENGTDSGKNNTYEGKFDERSRVLGRLSF